MEPTLRTRKPIDSLRLADLRAFPIWEFAIDEEGIEGQDETWVKPRRARTVPLNAFSLHVTAGFLASSGRKFEGFVTVTTVGAIELGHAAIIARSQYVFIPSNDFWDAPRFRRIAAQTLGLRTNELFPLTFSLRACVKGESTLRTGSFTNVKTAA